jgi:membrane protease YdiL (CAAX protease family)
MTTATIPVPDSARKLIASPRHTIGLLLIQLGLAAGGAYLQSRPSAGPNLVPAHTGIVPLYVSMIVLEWGLVWYVWGGIHDKGHRLLDLVGGRWNTWKNVALDLTIALPFWILWEASAKLVQFALGETHAKTVQGLLPQTWLEIVLWIALSASAGVCEEIVFRGYFQKQFQAITGSVALALLLQALVFGAGHAYQGMKQVVVISVLGALYGVLAAWRKNLRPGMIAHTCSDIVGGLLGK